MCQSIASTSRPELFLRKGDILVGRDTGSFETLRGQLLQLVGDQVDA